MNRIDRRIFFNRLSLGAIGTILMSLFPLSNLNLQKNGKKTKVRIKLHPNSVKRNK